MYEFTNDCLIGIKEIDDEHAKLFKMINDAISMGNELDNIAPVANNLIASLKDYAATHFAHEEAYICLLYTSPSPRDRSLSRMPSSA